MIRVGPHGALLIGLLSALVSASCEDDPDDRDQYGIIHRGGESKAGNGGADSGPGDAGLADEDAGSE